MCKKRIYIPKRKDILDEELGKFLNQYEKRNKLRIMFMRESEGIYMFGQRRICLKLEKNNKILARVGGGLMDINKFIELYTPEEVKKIQVIDAFEKFKNRVQFNEPLIPDNINVEPISKKHVKLSSNRSSNVLSPVQQNIKMRYLASPKQTSPKQTLMSPLHGILSPSTPKNHNMTCSLIPNLKQSGNYPDP